MRIFAAASPGEVRVAAVDGSGLVDYAIWRPGAPDGVGDLHRGRVDAVVPAMAGAFVALADDAGFLPDSAGGAGLTEGAALGVRVTRAAQGGKGPRLTAALTDDERAMVGAGAPALLRRGPNALLRLSALHRSAQLVVDDAALATDLRALLGDRLCLVPAAFDDRIETAVEALAEPVAHLAGGATLHIQPTSALTAIDVDFGAATAERRAKHVAQEAGNRALLPALARQIRLRNLGGAILVDLAGLSPKRRATLGPPLAAALAADPLAPRFLGFTALGLAEILRPRAHPPLHEMLAGSHSVGLAALRAVAAEVAARPGWTPALRAAPGILTALTSDKPALTDLARRAGRALILVEDRGLAPSGWSLEG